MRVETFVRNLGDLMPPAAVTSGPGPVEEAPWSEARPWEQVEQRDARCLSDTQ